MGISIDTGFILVLMTALCFHGREVDIDKRKKKAAEKKEKAELKKLEKLRRKRDERAKTDAIVDDARYRSVSPEEVEIVYAPIRNRRQSRQVSEFLDEFPDYNTARY